MSDYKNVSTEELQKKSAELQEKQDALRAERNAVNRELAFRDNLELRAKALKGMTAEEIERVKEMAQAVSEAGGVASGEQVDGLKS